MALASAVFGFNSYTHYDRAAIIAAFIAAIVIGLIWQRLRRR